VQLSPDLSLWIVVGVLAVLAVLVVVIGLAVILFLLRQFRTRRMPAESDLSIDVLRLDASGPGDKSPRLEYYGTPVRLAVLVLAPAGRSSELPPKDEMRTTIDRLIPGLADVVDAHQPIFRRWPEQLSSQGFAQKFFANVRLPGDRGRGTPWCGVAGKFDAGQQQLLVGLVCCADRPNALNQVIVQHEGLWHDVLRVRGS